MQSEIYHQNYQSFYPSEPFTLDHIVMRHPVHYMYTFKRYVEGLQESIKITGQRASAQVGLRAIRSRDP